MPDLAETIRINLAEVRGRITEAARRGGRAADQIALVAVTKFVGEAEIRALVEAGCTTLGESRPQHLWEKAGRLAGLPIHWHLIGPLQRNKVRRTLPLVAMVQSADSLELIAAIERHAAEFDVRSVSPLPQGEGQGVRAHSLPGRCIPVLLEVNTSGEEAKHGFAPDLVKPALPELAECKHVEVRGLMCMASLEGGLDRARRDFSALRELRDRLRVECPGPVRLDELSMGMSGDFEVAIEEGATMVRIGSALFEGLAG